jgi:hypothetical protein
MQSPRPSHVTPPATSENNSEVVRLIANLPFYRRFLRPPSTEAPSHHRNYPWRDYIHEVYMTQLAALHVFSVISEFLLELNRRSLILQIDICPTLTH